MPYFDKDGNEVEGLMTNEEVTKKIEEATAVYETEQAKITQQMEDLKKEVEEAKLAVDKAGDSGDKESNLTALRKKYEETQAALKTATEMNEQRWGSVQKEKVDMTIKMIAGDDEELGKKIKHHFESTLSAMKGDTAEEIKAKVTAAYKLSSDAPLRVDPLSFALGGSSRGVDVKSGGPVKPFSEAEKAVGNKLGLTDEDYKKYGNKV